MASTVNGSLLRAEQGEPTQAPLLEPAWREHFLKLLQRSPRFSGPRRFLQADIARAMAQAIRRDASVLEVGVGSGKLLASLPNQVRWGIDALPEAVEHARQLDSTLRLSVADAASVDLGRQFDAIICDRLCHSVQDIQRMLENLSRHLTPNGRIFLTAFNFLWAVPLAVGEQLGFNEASPPQNWLSASDLQNLFALTDLESIGFDDRLLVPAHVPFVSDWINRYGARLPPTNLFSVYRLYTLRHRQAKRTAPKVSVVVPARNEAGNIDGAIQRTPVMGAGTELIFVEGGSSDGTRERIQDAIARYQGPLELKLYGQTGKGKGDAVRTGFAHASGELLMILDADLTVVPEDLPKFYEAMVSGLTDYVHGTRLVYPMEDEAMRFLNKLGNAAFAKTFSFLLDQPIKDTLCGTKVLWRGDYQQIVKNRSYFGDFDPFGDFDLIFGARRIHLKIMEIPVRYRSRTYGETNISRFRHGLLLLRMCALASRKIKFV
jgi:2-polyprenyl-3-methyl-5-hydroxy-6-metoxy-1,4-benzoquinol methylase